MAILRCFPNARRLTLAVAVLMLGLLVGAAAQPRPADAGICFFCEGVFIDLSFDTMTFNKTDDGWGDNQVEVYASMVGEVVGGAGSVRNLGSWGSEDWCPSDGVAWFSNLGECPKRAMAVQTSSFAQAPLCTTNTYATCLGPWKFNNNKIRLQVKPGQTIRAAIHMKDYDELSPDDNVCWVDQVVGGFNIFQLLNLNQSFSMTQNWNGNGACTVKWSLKTATS